MNGYEMINFILVIYVFIFKCVCAIEIEESRTYPAFVSVKSNNSTNEFSINIRWKNENFTEKYLSENFVDNALESFPLIDGHNDFPFLLYSNLKNNLKNFNFNTDLKRIPGWESSHTDIPRLRKGKVGGQFWSAFVFCDTQYKDAVAKTLEQIDVIKRLIKNNSKDLQFVTTADDAFRKGKIASLIGIEGGHSIDSRLGVLRMYYDLGVRYITLTHTCNTPWASSSITNDRLDSRTADYGLTEFGGKIVHEMNKLGMLVDLSHVSRKTMYQALEISVAPVIFSHSSAFHVHNHTRNVREDILLMLKRNGGIIMINFYPGYIGGTLLHTVIAHINHVVDIIGPDHVGLGSDFDGIPTTPTGLEDVSKYPDLLRTLVNTNQSRWTQENLEKLIGRNFVRVFGEAERVRDDLVNAESMQDWISLESLLAMGNTDLFKCRSSDNEDALRKEIRKLNLPFN